MNKRDPFSAQQKKKLLSLGAHLFSQKKFYEAHEAWEEIWLRESGQTKKIYQGLIILAAGFHHLQKGKNKRAFQAFQKSFKKLVE